MLAGKTLAPTFLFIGYGVAKFFTMGIASAHWLDTYLAVGGGIASWIAVIVYDAIVSAPPSLLRMLCVLISGYIPLLYSLYAIGYLGVYTIYCSIFRSFSLLGIIFGLICIFLGYRMAYGLQAITEPRQPGPGASPA
jgi:hypothetical protein